ncbi:uncharacterized protein LOC133261041 [Bos javanicus]|uniref:uncharacterized protein LOC133261041 n=1 Tax=Bos javanicus TaxID=9906 RepID=UPI002AA74986|nr:uncharacterized protein LOC133261041 [Bos javanicus]
MDLNPKSSAGGRRPAHPAERPKRGALPRYPRAGGWLAGPLRTHPHPRAAVAQAQRRNCACAVSADALAFQRRVTSAGASLASARVEVNFLLNHVDSRKRRSARRTVGRSISILPPPRLEDVVQEGQTTITFSLDPATASSMVFLLQPASSPHSSSQKELLKPASEHFALLAQTEQMTDGCFSLLCVANQPPCSLSFSSVS